MTLPGLSQIEQQIERLTAQVAAQRQRMVDLLQRRAERDAAPRRRLAALAEQRGRQAEGLRGDVARLRAALRSQSLNTDKLTRLLPSPETDRVRLLERLERIAASGRPIVVGPWTGEVGYEVLYWIPFVRWFVEQFDVDPARLCVVSRGGPVSWYDGIAGRYVDALSVLSPEEFRSRTVSLDWMKQHNVTAVDREILRRTRGARGGGRPALLPPSLMFTALKGYWSGRRPLASVMRHTSHRRLVAPPPPPGLPSQYVAVRFYFRTSFPETPDNRALVARVLEALTARIDVVVLNPGFRIDDHHDYTAASAARVHTIDELLTPANNLDVQTAVIAGAQAFVGSYGGFAYLAPLLGVPAVAFYSEHSFKTSHLELAEHVFDRVGGASLMVLDTADAGMLGGVIPSSEGTWG